MKSITQHDLIEHFTAVIEKETGLKKDQIKIDLTFHQLGMDSISSIYFLEQIESHYNISMTPLYFWDYPTIRMLSEQLYKENFAK